ncbi:pyridoxamine 5'-phosphate oxidase family protein [Acidimangrovimonas pyrenivorans]|uniref:Pyridoxamine 5'-phosphate oxidase family protein n=1 Tax=Acidimangrovimonas pyrenivorans TaxID=2030798 RepID=A0ABV7AGQ6_9RHOB
MTRSDEIFHDGERAVQDRAGVPQDWRDRAARAIRPAMPAQHQRFVENLPLLFLGLQDGQGRPWASVSPLAAGARATAAQLSLDGLPVLADRLGLDLRPGARAAVLGLDFATRRRNRVNGTIAAATGEALTIAVEQSYGNCPKYIRRRDIRLPAGALPAAAATRIAADDAAARRIILSADTFFIATCARGGADVSHRGGPPGVLRPNADGALCFPDYAGNRYFNTLGNITASGRAGLLIPDFASGAAILLTGRARINWSAARTAEVDGAERIVEIRPDEIWHARGVFPGGAFTGAAVRGKS